jgi:hypothetical protein
MKNMIISGLIGTAFMAGGFWYGMRVAPVPPSKPKAVATQAQTPSTPAEAAAADMIGVEALKKTSEAMMTLNQALQAREKNVALREQKVREQEDELVAERSALDRTHEHFKSLFNEFQARLQLVEARQAEELQKQATLYTTMSIDQSIELIRAMDDPDMTRLFSVMDTKPLSKLIAAWKAKYPNDSQRILSVLDGMGRVLPKDQIAINEPPTTANPASPDSPAPAPTATPDTSAAPTDSNPPATTPGSTPSPSSEPATDPSAPAAPSSTPALQPPPDTTQNPVSTATTN